MQIVSTHCSSNWTIQLFTVLNFYFVVIKLKQVIIQVDLVQASEYDSFDISFCVIESKK